MSHYSSSSSPTSKDKVQVEVNDEIYDPGEEIMLCMLELSRKIHEASESNNEMRRRRRFIQRNREVGHLRLVNDYFSASPVYQYHIFRRIFRRRRELFLHIVNAFEANSMYFQLRNDAARRKGLSPLQKCTPAIHQLDYGIPADHLDEYLRMGKSTAIKCLFKFCQNLVELFGDRYLRRPNADDIQRPFQMHEERHKFPGQFTRGHGSPTIVLEAVAYQDLWIWHRDGNFLRTRWRIRYSTRIKEDMEGFLDPIK
ncbi:uncharacterized protein [Primulina eburnea]|uniref:uncharacterized protein n=1 Tax=Primulina eburnea TaxID=1245227 RepID=UPI003C6BE992